MARPVWPSDGDTNWGNTLRTGLNALSDGIDTANATLTQHTAMLADIQAKLAALGAGTTVPKTTVSATLGDASVTLTYSLTAGATSYLVGRNGVDQYGTGVTEKVVDYRDASVGTYTFSNLVPSATYQFYVQPLPGGTKVYLNATVRPQTTTNPTTTVTTVPGDGHVLVTWTPVTGATGYLVERDGTDATSGIGGGWSTTDPATATSRDFLSLQNGTAYTFSVTPLPGGTKKTSTTTPAVAAPPAGTTVVNVDTITTSSMRLTWTAVSGATGYLVGRDGTDAAGSGPFQTTVGAGVTSQVFSGLKPGTSYTLFCTPQPTGTKTSKLATTGSTATVPSGAGWLSGVSNIDQSQKDAFAAWRGEPLTCNRFWLSGPNQLLAGYYLNLNMGSWGGLLDYAIGAPPADGVSWASAASGGYDSQWRQQCQQIHANWGNLKGVYLAMAHELNGGWYSWTVNSSNASYFKTAWIRYYNIVTQELKSKGRNAKVTLNYASGQPNVALMWPGDAYVDIVGADMYDHYLPTSSGHIKSDADWNGYVNKSLSDGSPQGPGAWQQYALAHGKPFAMPEWGLSDTTSWSGSSPADPAYDNPLYIQKMHDFYAANAPADKYNAGAGKLAFENIFSSGGGDNYHLSIWPATSQNPSASAKYQSLSWGQ